MSQQFSVTGAGAITSVYVSGTIRTGAGTPTNSTPPTSPFSITGAGAITSVYVQGTIRSASGGTPTTDPTAAPTPAPTTTPTTTPTTAPTTAPTPAPTLAPNEQIDTSITATVTVDFPNITIGGKSSVYVRFSKAVTGVTADMMTAINGTLSGFTGSGDLYLWTLSTAGSSVGSGYVVLKGKVADAANPLKVNNILANDYFSVSDAPTTAPTTAPTVAPTAPPTTAPTTAPASYPAPEHVFDTAKVDFTYLVSDYPSGVVPVATRDTHALSVTPTAGLWYKSVTTAGSTDLYTASNGDKYVSISMSAVYPTTEFTVYRTLQAGKIGETDIYAAKTIGVAYPAATPAPTPAPTPAMPIPVYDHVTGAQVGTIPAGGSTCTISASISPPGRSGYMAALHVIGYGEMYVQSGVDIIPVDEYIGVYGVSITPSLRLVVLESEGNLVTAVAAMHGGLQYAPAYVKLQVTRVDLEPDNSPPPPKTVVSTATVSLLLTPSIMGMASGTHSGVVTDLQLHLAPTITSAPHGVIYAVI